MNISITLTTGAHFEYNNAKTVETSATKTVISSNEATLVILDNESIQIMEIIASNMSCVNFKPKI